ncbi:MAG: CIA30 family protein [Chromatiaceae bacterium]|nr:CIA30 family protein [Chromatiaceae bacterium]
MNGSTHSADDDNTGPIPMGAGRLVTDAVMGGVSFGEVRREHRAGRDCVCLSGDVRTDNDGGFIQLAVDLDEGLARAAGDFDGVRLEVLGNGQIYNVHLRTRDLWLPWQSYRAPFTAAPGWRTVELAFGQFEPYRTTTPLRVDRLKRVGIVAIGRDFAADVCVAGLSLYRNADR